MLSFFLLSLILRSILQWYLTVATGETAVMAEWNQLGHSYSYFDFIIGFRTLGIVLNAV